MPPASSFSARFRSELSRSRTKVAAALLVTLVAPALVLTARDARATSRPAPPAIPEAPAPALALPAAPGDARGWNFNAKSAAATCPGLPPEVLVAIGHVESRLGEQLGPSSAGALGPMQFLPSTWEAYGVDGSGDGRADIMDPLDALHAAARLLCANGGSEPDRLRSALWNYNHSHDYVERVVRVAGLVR